MNSLCRSEEDNERIDTRPNSRNRATQDDCKGLNYYVKKVAEAMDELQKVREPPLTPYVRGKQQHAIRIMSEEGKSLSNEESKTSAEHNHIDKSSQE